MNTTPLSEVIRQNITANVMEAGNHLPAALSLAQRNLAQMFLEHLKSTVGDEEAQKQWTIPQPIFISHPAYTEVNLVNATDVALGSPSNAWLRVVYYSGKLFTERRQVPENNDWIEPAIEAIFGGQPHVIFRDKLVRSAFVGLNGTWGAVDQVVEDDKVELSYYAAVASTEYYENHSIQKLYYIYHDGLRLFLVDATGWGQGTPGAHRLVGFSIEGLGFYQNAHENGLGYTEPQTNQYFTLTGPLETKLSSVWLHPKGEAPGVYAYRPNPATPASWQYRLTSHKPGDVPETLDGTQVAEQVADGDAFERREKLLATFVAKHEGADQASHDYGLLVTILARQIPKDLLRDVFIDGEGSLVMDVGLGAGGDERFTFRVWGGEVADGATYQPRAVAEVRQHNTDLELLETYPCVESSADAIDEQIGKHEAAPVGREPEAMQLFEQFGAAKEAKNLADMKLFYGIATMGDLFPLLPCTKLSMEIAIQEVGEEIGEQANVSGDRTEYLARKFLAAWKDYDLSLMESLLPEIEAEAEKAKEADPSQATELRIDSMLYNFFKGITRVRKKYSDDEGDRWTAVSDQAHREWVEGNEGDGQNKSE